MTALTIPRREPTRDELSTIELAPGVSQVVTEDEKFALKNESEPQQPPTANMRSELTTFPGFLNRYYPLPYGKQASDWLLGEFLSVVSASGTTRASGFRQRPQQVRKAPRYHPGGYEGPPEQQQDHGWPGGQHPRVPLVHGRGGRDPGPAGACGTRTARAARSSRPLLQQDMTRYGNNPMGVITVRVDSCLMVFVRKAIDAHTPTGYANTQCGYGCSVHASASVIEAAVSRTSPYNHADGDAVSTLNFSHTLEHAKLAVGYAYELTLASVFGKRRGEGGVASVIC
ncbi:hypothetical protein DL765_000692 [Monosporascus sp. GIB2]|nr:hypothetical protein DL765_000692 [Monosporascus sp. GIB2]